jgi:hypothetical protein
VGAIFTPLFVHWVVLFMGAIVARPRSKIGIALGLLHPAPWLVFVGAPYWAIYLFKHPQHVEFLWFLGVVVVTFIGILVYSVIVAVLRSRAGRISNH